jgi:hypothetical protein
MTPGLIWGGLLLAGLAYENYVIVNTDVGDTLSERVRAWFRTHTSPGPGIVRDRLGGLRRLVPGAIIG